VVVAQPPAVGRRHDEVAGAAGAKALEVADRLGGIGRMMPGPAAVDALREVAGAATVEHRFAQVLGLAFVARIGATAVGLPVATPLLRVARLVGAQDAAVLAAGDQVAEGGLAEMVDDNVLDAALLVAGGAGAVGVVVVLQQADLIALVERAEPQERLAPQRQAVHRRRAQLQPVAGELVGPAGGEIEELSPAAVIGLDL